jgi:hypothetical protein
VDYPFSRDGTSLPPVLSPKAETQIGVFRQVLASDASDDLKSYDLCWLLHIVGDVHQPLHCTARVTKADPTGDKGGNDVKLTDQAPKLHAFWDETLDFAARGASPPWFAQTLKKADKKQAAERDEKRWVQESFKIAKDKIYKKPIGSDNGPFALTKYRGMASKLAKQRVELAGERLANLLNTELK